MGANNLNKKALKKQIPQTTEGLILIAFTSSSDLPVSINADDVLSLATTPTLDQVVEAGNVATGSITASSFTDSKGAVKPFKYYTGQLSKDATTSDNIVDNPRVNQLSGPVVWTRDGVGNYKGTLTSAFPQSKTIILYNFKRNGVSTEAVCDFTYESDNILRLKIYTSNGTTPIDGFFLHYNIMVF